MADKKMDPTEKGGKKFHIQVDEKLKGNFPDQREIQVVLSDDSAAQLDVFQKDIPAVLKGVQYKGKAVKWLNNFGMKKKGSARFEEGVDRYTVILDKIDGAEYVYYDGPTDKFDAQRLHALETTAAQDQPGKVQASLNRGDPAVGWIK